MIAVLHNVRSSHNVGSIFRTADAAGFAKVYLCGITPAPFDKFKRPNRELTKVALGAEKYLAWEKVKSTTNLIKKLKRESYAILAVEQDKKAVPYYKYNLLNPPYIKGEEGRGQSPSLKIRGGREGLLALVVGDEVRGLPSSILKLADHVLEIPMHGKKESLNVAVAFGIVAFSLIKKR